MPVKHYRRAKPLESGARGIVMKHSATELLYKSIRMVAAGQYWVGRECVGDLIHKMRERQAPSLEAMGPSFGLTPRELELVGSVVEIDPVSFEVVLVLVFVWLTLPARLAPASAFAIDELSAAIGEG